MAIPFEEIPPNILVPLFYAETKPAQTPYNASLKMMVVGHRHRAAGEAVNNTPYRLSGDEAARLFGRGSMVEAMYRKARANGPFIEIWGVGVEPAVAATTSQGSIRVASLPTVNAAIWFSVAGYGVSVVVRTTDTKTQIASRIGAAINKATHLPVSASLKGVGAPDNETVILTCKWAGYTGNYIRLEKTAWGVENRWSSLIAVTAMGSVTAGAGNAGISAALASIAEDEFDVLVIGNQGVAGQLNELDTYFDHTSGRWSPYKQTYGHAFIGSSLPYADLITLGNTRNGPHVTVIPTPGAPTPQWEWAAALAARATQHWATPPELSRPLQTIELVGVEPPRNPADWFTIEERQALLTAGISTWRAMPDRRVVIDRVVTTYKANAWGDPDASWRDAVTMFQIMFFVRYMRTQITGLYPRAALTDEDVGIEGFTSPQQIKDALISGYDFLASVGLVENTEAFAAALVVERNAFDANRVDVLARPDLVNQLRILAMLVETHLTIDSVETAA